MKLKSLIFLCLLMVAGAANALDIQCETQGVDSQKVASIHLKNNVDDDNELTLHILGGGTFLGTLLPNSNRFVFYNTKQEAVYAISLEPGQKLNVTQLVVLNGPEIGATYSVICSY